MDAPNPAPASPPPHVARIIERLQEVVPDFPACPICRTLSGFELGPGLVYLAVSPFGGPLIPPFLGPTSAQACAVLTCKKCGNTVLINLATLGLNELTGLVFVDGGLQSVQQHLVETNDLAS